AGAMGEGASGAAGVAPTGQAVAAPEKSAKVTVRVVSTPAGADVYLGDERTPRGKTPLALTMARAEVATRLTVRMKGYEAQASEVVPDSDSRLQMTLSKVALSRPAASGRPQKRPGKKASPQPAAPRAPVPDLHRGDVVDPFAR
ncbi:MAG: hypothetical protein JWN44_5162, partial [Myxococcales bacterium]|nr:hypothetical protein [Myxococcales bacterium]